MTIAAPQSLINRPPSHYLNDQIFQTGDSTTFRACETVSRVDNATLTIEKAIETDTRICSTLCNTTSSRQWRYHQCTPDRIIILCNACGLKILRARKHAEKKGRQFLWYNDDS